MASAFQLKPEERINEGALARQLGASRTPVREALNRLVAEGYLTFQSGRGFFCRALNPDEIVDLYEARIAIEVEAIRLATARATPAQRADIRAFLVETEAAKSETQDVEYLVTLDEIFHMKIAHISGNRELARMLENINGRIRFVRWIDMQSRKPYSQSDHFEVVDVIDSGNAENAASVMRKHVHRRAEEITSAVATGYSQIYVPSMMKPERPS